MKNIKPTNKELVETLDKLRETTFFQFEKEISHKQVIPYATYAPWEQDEEFKALFSKIKNNTLVDIYRSYELWTMTKDLQDLEGDILEVGVWRGGTGAIFCKAAENSKSTTYLADTFTGVVKATEEDAVYRGGEHSDTSEQIVVDLLNEVEAKNFKILKGIFPDDFPELKVDKFKLCHIDVDTYLSAKEIYDYVWDKLEVGGMVIFDDCGFWTCEGVTKYFNALNPKNGRKIYNLNGHGILVKISN